MTDDAATDRDATVPEPTEPAPAEPAPAEPTPAEPTPAEPQATVPAVAPGAAGGAPAAETPPVATAPVRAGRGPAGIAGYLGAAVLGIIVGAAGLGVATGTLGGAASPSPSPSPSPTAVPAAEGNTVGSPDAPVTIEVWADYQCPFCKLEDFLFGGAVEREYVMPGIARVVYRDFAFLGQESIDAAAASRCAGRQEPAAQLRYHDALYTFQQGENQGRFVRENLIQIATIAGVPDVEAFGACLDDPAIARAVAEETTTGRNAGIGSTPTLRLLGPGGERVLSGFSQEWPRLRDAIEAIRNPAAPGASGVPGGSASPATSPGASASPSPAATAGASESPAP